MYATLFPINNSRHVFFSLDILSQLPPKGGKFYTNDTRDAARAHYKSCWPPILLAVSLWLRESGFTSVDKDEDAPANMKVDESDVSRFHLLFGES